MGSDYMSTVTLGNQPSANTSTSRLAWADRNERKPTP